MLLLYRDKQTVRLLTNICKIETFVRILSHNLQDIVTLINGTINYWRNICLSPHNSYIMIYETACCEAAVLAIKRSLIYSSVVLVHDYNHEQDINCFLQSRSFRGFARYGTIVKYTVRPLFYSF